MLENVKLIRDSSKLERELDGVCCRNGRLGINFCKVSRKFERAHKKLVQLTRKENSLAKELKN